VAGAPGSIHPCFRRWSMPLSAQDPGQTPWLRSAPRLVRSGWGLAGEGRRGKRVGSADKRGMAFPQKAEPVPDASNSRGQRPAAGLTPGGGCSCAPALTHAGLLPFTFLNEAVAVGFSRVAGVAGLAINLVQGFRT
jgi:hypothetical protein